MTRNDRSSWERWPKCYDLGASTMCSASATGNRPARVLGGSRSRRSGTPSETAGRCERSGSPRSRRRATLGHRSSAREDRRRGWRPSSARPMDLKRRRRPPRLSGVQVPCDRPSPMRPATSPVASLLGRTPRSRVPPPQPGESPSSELGLPPTGGYLTPSRLCGVLDITPARKILRGRIPTQAPARVGRLFPRWHVGLVFVTFFHAGVIERPSQVPVKTATGPTTCPARLLCGGLCRNERHYHLGLNRSLNPMSEQGVSDVPVQVFITPLGEAIPLGRKIPPLPPFASEGRQISPRQ